ncbi:monovalent cation:proton antiporter family protein [Bacillus solimangrovi]|uniref:Sodium:proton antiporter n=1 Tax=Bacillus solimangrovi TaxID=1305675 RepID=A0A1E5LC76_9BACI|nr:monovalent cation:proton antiporter family protein [Bacillus solimangrovi]OEH91599.1 sodium:proton antiporter [Bacillus solimangrovi]
MEQHASVTSLVIVIIVAFLTPILLHRLKLNAIPVVVAEIIMGLIIGKSGFNVVHPDIWLETLSTLGFIFLMFLSGLEIDFSAFAGGKKKKKEDEPNAFIVAFIIFIGIFLLSLLLSFAFVWAGFIDNAFLMTLIISTISLGVVVPTLKDAQIMKSNIGQTILLVAVIADLVTMILLAVFVSLYGEGQGSMWLLLILFGAGVLLYFVGKNFQHKSFVETMATGTIQIGTRAVFALIIFLVALSESVGAENILGAFLAGVLVSLLSPNSDMVHKLDSFGYGFLIPIFFVMVGVELNVRELFGDSSVLILIPLLLIALFASKIVPAFILRRWYDWNTVFASGFLLTSTLSLVIAASTIGERMGVIDANMSGALILVAVIASILAPILFQKAFKKQVVEHNRTKIAFIGANRMTLPVTRELDPDQYETFLYHTKQDKIDNHTASSCYHIREVEDYDVNFLSEQGVFDVDMLIVSTGEESTNREVALYAKEHEGVPRVIARIETSDGEEKMKAHNIDVFSVLMSTKTLLKALIESPSVMNLFTKQENALYQINMHNPEFNGVMLRNFTFTGDVIMVRVFRGKDSIVPHGDTELKLGDRLIVTGSAEYVEELKMILEYCEWC